MRIFTVFAILFFPTLACALPAQDTELTSCKYTPWQAHKEHAAPDTIIGSANLVRPVGKAENAPGIILQLSGRVTDERCTPLTGAVVEIWQADTEGKYMYPHTGQLASSRSVFAGSGRTTTDNLGRFRFTTLFPGTQNSAAPHIHLQIRHDDFETFTTILYFAGDSRNADDPALKKLSEDSRKRLSAFTARAADRRSIEARFDITLRGRAKHRKF